MRFDAITPNGQLKPYIKQFVISENSEENSYKVFPSTGLVLGFQYRGRLATLQDQTEKKLDSAGITGLSDRFKIFKSSANIGTILVYFTEIGWAHFSNCPAHELFNQTISLHDIFKHSRVTTIEERLAESNSDWQRIALVEDFLLTELQAVQTDRLVEAAVRLIVESKGNIKIKDLSKQLLLSQSPLEKRFRKIVGSTPKKFATIVRFNSVLQQLGSSPSLSEICYANNFFDQAHFIKDFKQYTGHTPEQFKLHFEAHIL